MPKTLRISQAATWPTAVAIILVLAWMGWGLAKLLSGGWIDQKIVELRYGGRPLARTPVPEIKDWNSLRILLSQGCLTAGCPPGYRIEIVGPDRVEFEGAPPVAVPGRHGADLDPAKVRALFEQFRRAEFFSLRPEYIGAQLPGGVNQPPSWTLSLAFDDRPPFQVIEFRGETLGMPKEVSELQNAVYRQSGAERWVVGNAQTVPSLEAEGWDLAADTPQNGALLVGAAEAHNLPLMNALIKAGAPVKGVYGCRALTASAFGRAYKQVFQALLSAGAPLKAGDCVVPDKWPGLGGDPL